MLDSRRPIAVLCAVLAALALAAPAAAPRQIRERDYAPTVTRSVERKGFDWGSAAIGAGAATALALLARAVIAPRPVRSARR